MTESTTKKRRGRPPGRKYPCNLFTAVSQEMEEAVKRVAAEETVSESEVIRRALDAYMKDRAKTEAQLI